MNNKALTLSIVMAVIAVLFVQSYVSSLEENYTKQYGTKILVLKAKREIKEQDTLNETVLEFALMPKQFLEPNAVSLEAKDDNTKEISRSLREFAGAVALVPLKPGEQITYNKISQPSIRTGLAPQVSPGHRAVAIPVNEISGVAKLIKPGDRVDLIAVVDPGGGKENKIAKTILQDVMVLAVGRNVSGNAARLVEPDPYGGKDRVKSLTDDASFASVTIEVDPAQAQMLALMTASSDNSLSLSLRNNDDSDRATLNSTTYGDVLGVDANRLRIPAGGRR